MGVVGLVTSLAINVQIEVADYCATITPCCLISGFLLELQKDRSKIADAVTLLSVPDQIHILLIKTNPSGEKNLVGSHSLKWRTILAAETGCLRNSIEINGVGTEAKVPVGVLDMKLEIIPRLTQV